MSTATSNKSVKRARTGTGPRMRDTAKNCYTQLKISRDIHRTAKAAALMIGEEFYQFVEESIKLRIEALKNEGKLQI